MVWQVIFEVMVALYQGLSIRRLEVVLIIAVLDGGVGINTIASEAQYAYDDLGRLTAVVDEAGNTAIYNYDAVGNLLSIERFTPGASGIGIYAVLPGKGAVGAQVKIQGYGFDPTPSNNTVTFNGTSGTVVSSTSYAIIATVPASATTGTVVVTNTNGKANSPQAFTTRERIDSVASVRLCQAGKVPLPPRKHWHIRV